MGDTFEKFTVAAVHAAATFLDRDAGVEKTCRLIAEAAGKGAKLIDFPETFIPGYHSVRVKCCYERNTRKITTR